MSTKRMIVITLAVVLSMLLVSAASAAGPLPQEEGQAYTVQAGDWLSKIAEKYYGDVMAYPLIVEATNAKAKEDSSFATITDPDMIEVGQKLWIPVAAGAEEHAGEETAHKPHWSYEGEGGPEHWGDLDPEFVLCGTGESQSPVDIVRADAIPQELPNIAFNYQPTEVKIINNGHAIQVNYDPGSYIEVDGVRYDLLQFHFHAPSEHTFDGKLLAMEMHLVHKSADGKLAVVGVMIEEGAENAAYQPVWDNLPAEEGPEQATGLQVNAADLLPAEKMTYRYSGSLTTPPCSEGVSWFVMTNPVALSAKQITAFESIYKGNNRPVLPLHGREIVVDTSAE
jgi:carbonic anhydrase